MAITSLSWSRLLAAGCLLLTAAAARAQEARCPAFEKKQPLVSAVVFDGPPEKRTDLMPDVSHGTGSHAFASWDVGYIFDKGHTLFLLCRFAHLADESAVTVKVDHKVSRCVYRTHPQGRPAEIACR